MDIVERLRSPNFADKINMVDLHNQAADEIERLRDALETAAVRLAHLAGQIEAGFNISGTLRAEQAMEAQHMSDEARAALKGQS